MSQNNKPQTWDELIEREMNLVCTLKDCNGLLLSSLERDIFRNGLYTFERHLSSHPRVVELLGALEKIADPRKRDHQEPDIQTELYCVMHIAESALEEFKK